jgi:acetoin utilization deacetylase AcuC-like enzyme
MGSALFFSHPACLEHETTVGHPERPARIIAVERALEERGWLGFELRQAPPASRETPVAMPWLGYACGCCNYCVSGWETLCLEQKMMG